MAQRSILSFFAVKSEKKKESVPEVTTQESGSELDSPVKAQTRKRRQRIESSSSEEEKDVKKSKLQVKSVKNGTNSEKEDRLSEHESSEEVSAKKEEKSGGQKIDIVSKLSKFAVGASQNGKNSIKSEKKDIKTEENDSESVSPEKEAKTEAKSVSNTPSRKTTVKKADKTPESQRKKNFKSKSMEKKSPKSNGDSEKSPQKSPKKDTEDNKSPAKGMNIEPQKSLKKDEKDVQSYNPSAEKYHPIKSACWNRGDKVPYLALSRTLEEIEHTSARLKMIDILSNYFRSVLVLSPEDFLPSVYLCLNKIGPAYEGMELGLAEQTLIRAISQSTGRTFTQIKNDVTETGDLGSVAEKSRSSQKLMFQPQPLNVRGMFQKFRDIAAMTGQSAVNKKISTIQGLFVACKGPEARFLIRSLNGKLRIGLAEQSVLQAIAQACAMTPPCQDFPPDIVNTQKDMSTERFKEKLDELALTLKTTYCECPNYDLIVPVILREGILALPKHCKITPGIPVKPMLAQPTKGVQEVFTRFEGLEFTCEWKYDGERAQIHGLENGSIKIYSRNQEDNTSKYPDIISRMPAAKAEDTRTFILDCEAVAWDCTEKRILPFQILSTRKRKDANEAEIKVQVCVFMFDLLYLNGEPLVRQTLAERRKLLHQHFKAVEGQWKFATAIDTTKMEEVQEFLEESIKGQCEGLMVKTLKEEATYEIAKRSRNWLKLKKDYMDGVGDTLDLVVMGGYFGKGKRTGTYGGFLIGCYDEDSEEYQTLCKIGTGFTDENLQTHTQFFKDHIVPKAPSYYQHDSSLAPDHWFEPIQVWEIRCADLSLSPIHRAALGLIDPDKGISLRFPRFLRVRDDKGPEQATSARQVADMYKGQEQVMANSKGKSSYNEEDFY